MKGKIVVLYYTAGIYPIRDTIHKHLYSWGKYSSHDVIYINLAYSFPSFLLKNITIDVIVFHTIFLGSMRWNPNLYPLFTKICEQLKQLNCTKIAFPQDEFLHTEILNKFINDFNITHVYTCAFEKDWKYIYNKVNFDKVKFKTVLTGYIDEETVNKVEKLRAQITNRNIDIGYRAWAAEYWLGALGQFKSMIGYKVMRIAKRLNMKLDLSTKEKDTLNGDDWFNFLLRCKSTLGVEGGASVLDRFGTIKKKVNEYMNKNPRAPFKEVKKLFFDKNDGKLHLACISPRHLEACITKTCQLLIEGNYNGILKPWKHYLPIKKDYSNIRQILDLLRDEEYINIITDAAYVDIVGSQKYSYIQFIKMIELEAINRTIPRSRPFNANDYICTSLIMVMDRLNWLIIKNDASKTNLLEKKIVNIYEKLTTFIRQFKPKYVWNSWNN